MATILVVDDEATICTLVRRALETSGYRVLEASDGILGLKLAQLEQPDLILLDIALPQMSGLEVSRRLLGNAKTASIPVLYLTGLVPEAVRDTSGSVRGYIAKPFSPTLLIERIETELYQARPSAMATG